MTRRIVMMRHDRLSAVIGGAAKVVEAVAKKAKKVAFEDRTGAREKTDAGTGAGSRGGVVIGTTSSGKPIYKSHGHPSHGSFSKDDHKDAARLHQKKLLAAKETIDASGLGSVRESEVKKSKGLTAALEADDVHREGANLHLNDSHDKKVRKNSHDTIGHTKSGRAVEAGGQNSTVFTGQDHKDAAKLHKNFAKEFPDHASNQPDSGNSGSKKSRTKEAAAFHAEQGGKLGPDKRREVKHRPPRIFVKA